MIEDLTGNIRRVVDGLAAEIGKRVAATAGETAGTVAHNETRQVLLEWFLGDFIPGGTAPQNLPKKM
jgi:hypothetical protein